MLQHYLKIAWRQILKNKTQYILSLVGIAIGLLCFGVTCYYVRNNCLDYTAWENADRMGSFNTINRENGNSETFITGVALQGLLDNRVEGIDKIALYDRWNGANVTFVKEEGEVPFLCSIANVNEDFPEVYSLRMISPNCRRSKGVATTSSVQPDRERRFIKRYLLLFANGFPIQFLIGCGV